MLTPAEERGLAGQGVAGRVLRALHVIPDAEMLALLDDVDAESRRQRLFYLRDGLQELVRVLPLPLTVLPEQVQYLHYVSLTLHAACKRLIDLYLADPDVREALLLPPDEEEWLRSLWKPRHRDQNPVFGRLDAVIDYQSAGWKDTLQFIEPNLSGVGGLHLLPAAERVVAQVILPRIEKNDPALELHPGADIRELLVEELAEHLKALGRPGRRVCFVEQKYAQGGPEEEEELASFLTQKFGFEVCQADASELSRDGDEVLYQGRAVDIAYRDYSLENLLDLRKRGVDVSPMRALFEQNRVVSSLAGELDQKACWEVFSDEELAARHFNAEERRIFRRHIPWTRVVGHRRTRLPDGAEGDLPEFARKEREMLVLKPNRSYGGQGVLLGQAQSEAEWGAALDRALREPHAWVVQRLVNLPVHEFPARGVDGRLYPEPYYVVMGLTPSADGLSILGRGSQKQVVNVAQRGGLCVVFIGRGPGRMIA